MCLCQSTVSKSYDHPHSTKATRCTEISRLLYTREKSSYAHTNNNCLKTLSGLTQGQGGGGGNTLSKSKSWPRIQRRITYSNLLTSCAELVRKVLNFPQPRTLCNNQFMKNSIWQQILGSLKSTVPITPQS